ncbi:hypothetical protein OAF42_02965 [Planctomicrobium sp.]|jgi:hypothetical protein|nr:hypothetical protein [Planctomicrobium sp.]MDA7527460.1 hypothetical protein [bacterium]MDB4439814.1 hypothetical protein [Planctomicrobium sp.]MDB4731685.1 hypothetical protein [bacterium]MDB4733385.1 hypothetical protein [Planctomicrobium sp.]
MLRTCERLGIHFEEFQLLEYSQQVKLLAYNSVRQLEENESRSQHQ